VTRWTGTDSENARVARASAPMRRFVFCSRAYSRREDVYMVEVPRVPDGNVVPDQRRSGSSGASLTPIGSELPVDPNEGKHALLACCFGAVGILVPLDSGNVPAIEDVLDSDPEEQRLVADGERAV
jgi:hypothetical protein